MSKSLLQQLKAVEAEKATQADPAEKAENPEASGEQEQEQDKSSKEKDRDAQAKDKLAESRDWKRNGTLCSSHSLRSWQLTVDTSKTNDGLNGLTPNLLCSSIVMG